MSCGEPHEKDCSEVLDHLYEYLDREMPEGECADFQVHLDECSPCLEKYGLEQAVKKLVKRCCGHDDVPSDLRSKVMGRIDLIRAGETVPEVSVLEQAKREQAQREQADAGAGSAEAGPADARTEAARSE
ncbi:mycothiol system anti-sigma-R factor [Streptomyces kronopolitis]|uniref:mycothiol system anti-sigma-R factor n=1 Tax=Streptomyces TaxID=1883 RepID=UPI0020C03DD0|nr:MULTISPECIES: mycothiol system anti-sigma-R factor [Streptomyces]MCL6302379.1 mycothiol system anti-sigma-R factor [Streptomyces kronopolitis]GLW16062.1 anti-sigma factor RsrA [Streptomyces sp. NBRC 13847]